MAVSQRKSTTAAEADSAEQDHWRENYAVIPMWLTRGTTRGSKSELTHAQFRILVVLITLLAARRGKWHISYRRIAELSGVDPLTVTEAMRRFTDAGWIEASGGRNWRRYRIDLETIQEDAYAEYDDGEEEE